MQKAIPYLKDKPNINLAYAQLMNNDNRAALETFRKIKMQNAMDYYMQAVAAARIKRYQRNGSLFAKGDPDATGPEKLGCYRYFFLSLQRRSCLYADCEIKLYLCCSDRGVFGKPAPL